MGARVRGAHQALSNSRRPAGEHSAHQRRQGTRTGSVPGWAPTSALEDATFWKDGLTGSRGIHCPPFCAAIVDRLTFGGNIIETGTDSYRLASTRARAEQQVTAG